MDRRTFLKATTACAATAAASTAAPANAASPQQTTDNAPATSGDIVRLRLSAPWPDNLAGPSDQAHRLTRDIKSVSSGRIVIEIDEPNMSSGDATATTTGNSDLEFTVLHTRANAPKASLYFSGLPHAGGLSASNLEGWVNIAGGQTLWDDLIADIGFKPILAGHLGEMPGLWSKTPIRSSADLFDRKIVATSTKPDVLRTLGAIPVDVPPAKLKTALADGAVDVVEYGGFQTAMSVGLHEAANHVTQGLLNPTGTALALLIPTDFWHAMSDTDKNIITTCANHAYRLTCTENRALQKPLGLALREHHGVEIHTLEKADTRSWQRIADTYLAHISGADERAKRINASYSAFKNLAV